MDKPQRVILAALLMDPDRGLALAEIAGPHPRVADLPTRVTDTSTAGLWSSMAASMTTGLVKGPDWTQYLAVGFEVNDQNHSLVIMGAKTSLAHKPASPARYTETIKVGADFLFTQRIQLAIWAVSNNIRGVLNSPDGRLDGLEPFKHWCG